MPSRSARNRVRRVLDAACVIAICINVGYMVWHNRTYKHVTLDQYEADKRARYSNAKNELKNDVIHDVPVDLNRNPLRHVFKFSEQREAQVLGNTGGQKLEQEEPNNGRVAGQFDHREVRVDLVRVGQSDNTGTIRSVDTFRQIEQQIDSNGRLEQPTSNNELQAIGQMDTRLEKTVAAGQLGRNVHARDDLNLTGQNGLDVGGNNLHHIVTPERFQEPIRVITTIVENFQELCPLMPNHLNGALRCECNDTSAEFLVTKYPDIIKGGRVKPNDCLPREQVAIIIPYRDRSNHLHKLLKMLIPILTRQKIDATFYVIEQSSPLLFNRGALHNIGFLESLKLGSYNCFIFHDVDMMPVNDKLMYRCADNPVHFSAAIKYHGVKTYFKKMHDDNFGGVVGFTRDQYLAINGNSNLYFGWGGEDDDLYQRVKNKNMSRIRHAPELARYEMLVHERQEKISANPTRVEMLKSSRSRQTIDGLNTVQYKVNYVQLHHLYTWINADINMGELFQNAPIFMQRSIRAMNALLKKMLNGTQPA